ncbi:protein FAR1-RELATED SEQUENCE 5-like [Aegilops tauschii subsp. strangulata]|uniref:protein FAR1-RELATED SEQUENCE 5-like n=1 Tax=Aegilops tauschii subsp. strangulata TaxID=200361 RepID=UPI000989EA2E|nr:protein FAR1-RELATED SEQUENCE 5-like [Aegilops tauschii subsp. strangulata]
MQLDNHTHAQMMSTLSHMSSGPWYMGHTTRDWVNKKQKFAGEESQDDVKKLLDFFKKMLKINPEFFFDYDVDADNRVRNVFWANASCKGSYEDFGDCITFDTTYKTNKFHMPLGVFAGVNHHLQSTIFAVALVRDETIPSFEWVFKTFLRCMNNKPPICMLTDQCSSMKAALKTILPDTLHKLCRWHIMKKYKDHLALLYKAHEKLKDDLNAVLNHPLMPSEFERAWKDLMQKYNLQNDEVDKCIQTRKAVEHIETVANESEVKTTTQFGFEVQLSKVYTRAVFADFKETLYRNTAFRAEWCPENQTKYLVHHYNRSDAFDWAWHKFQVVADEEKGVYECECKLWTHTGATR